MDNSINRKSISFGGFNDLVMMKDGWMVYNKNDKFVGKSIKEYGEWSAGEINLLKQILKPNHIVIEVGSNIGSHTLPIAKIVDQGIVFAFEPQNVIFQTLCANISINSLTNCFCFQSALTDKKDRKLYNYNYNYNIEQNFGGMSFLDNKKEDITYAANVDTLDDKFSDLNSLNLLKTDAEGMEVDIIKGGIDLIRRNQPILYVENDYLYVDKSQELIELLWSLNYKLFWHIIPYYNKDNFFKNTNNIFENYYHCNMLGVPKEMKTSLNLPEVVDASYHPFSR